MKTAWKILILLMLPALLAAGDDVAGAAALVNQGQYQEAAQAYETLAARDPENASFHHSLGLCYQALDDYVRAVGSLERAVALAENPAPPAYSLALLHEALAERNDRKSHLERAREAWKTVVMRGRGPQSRTAARHLERIESELRNGR